MLDEIQEVIRQFQARELPRDAEYFQRRRDEVNALVDALQEQTGRSISWEPPMDLFNFYHLQLPVDSELHVAQLYGKSNNLLQRLADQGQSTNFLHLLVSTFSRWVGTYWQRFPCIGGGFQEEILWADNFESADEQHLLQVVKSVLEAHGWLWLPSAEGAEIVPEAEPIWPLSEGAVLVRHILFPGCGILE